MSSNMGVRRLRLKPEYQLLAKEASRTKFGTLQALAEAAELSRTTTWRFLKGEHISVEPFSKLCHFLELDEQAAGETVFESSAQVTGIQVTSILEDLKVSSPDDIQEIAASQIQLLHAYYSAVLNQSQRSFKWALVAAVAGFAFFVVAVTTLMVRSPRSNLAWISLLSGAVIEVISGVNFYLYGKTTSQLAQFQDRLDTTQRYLLANSLCERLEGEYKHQARIELIRSVAKIDAPAKPE